MNDFLNPNEINMNEEQSNFKAENTTETADDKNFSEENANNLGEQTMFKEDNQAQKKPEEQTTDKFFNPITYTSVEPINDYKPMNKGIKVFALVIVAVILLAGSCVAGYFMGLGSGTVTNNDTQYSTPEVDLTERPANTDEMTVAQVYQQVNKSVVGIFIYNNSGDAGQATGIVYSKDGYIITNDHIYSDIPSPKFKIFTHDGKEYQASYVAGDQISDLAVLKIDDAEFEPAIFGDSGDVYYGQNVVAIGRPNGADKNSSITDGVISAIARVQGTTNYSSRLIQTSCAINPGNSGGALCDMYGMVVGITSSKLAGTEYDNVGYAIPTTVMKRVVEELIANGKVVTRAKLGITYTAVNSVVAESNNYLYTGLLIVSVSEDSGLYGKIEKGDYITHINGIAVTSDTIVLDIIEKCSAGDKIDVTIVDIPSCIEKIETVELKANIGQSSYTTKENSTEDSQNGGTFDFPFGE